MCFSLRRWEVLEVDGLDVFIGCLHGAVNTLHAPGCMLRCEFMLDPFYLTHMTYSST